MESVRYLHTLEPFSPFNIYTYPPSVPNIISGFPSPSMSPIAGEEDTSYVVGYDHSLDPSSPSSAYT